MFIDNLVVTLSQAQHSFNDSILSQLQSIRDAHSLIAYAGLMAVGFVYGILHAVGPGHGKVVVSGYMLANENSLKRGIVIVALSSLMQALTAIVLVESFFFILHMPQAQAEHWAGLLELVSYGGIGCIGLYLMVQGLLTLRPRKTQHAHAHNEHNQAHEHEHHHHHDHDGHCCHHAPVPTEGKNYSLTAIAGMIVSIGIRPCTGSLLLLYFACLFGLGFAGALATLAMGVGTAITTGSLAILAVKSRSLAMKFVNKSDRALTLAHGFLRLAGGGFILLLSVLFALPHLQDTAPPAVEQHPLFKSIQ
ncbi:MAG: hypothetical protein JO126_03845 [Alphaproteobacteria bacterium]|nr:hypothetical protein [Alphaproteobacteria bacterium]MBV8548572.1 hypothetical protein [Alphaproteobacteria bacterium]